MPSVISDLNEIKIDAPETFSSFYFVEVKVLKKHAKFQKHTHGTELLQRRKNNNSMSFVYFKGVNEHYVVSFHSVFRLTICVICHENMPKHVGFHSFSRIWTSD